MSKCIDGEDKTLTERGVIRVVYQFRNRLELIVVRISVKVGIRKGRIFFILDSRITSTLQRLTFPCGILATRYHVDSIYPQFEDNEYKILVSYAIYTVRWLCIECIMTFECILTFKCIHTPYPPLCIF
jgi:hypothetical protein